MAGELLIFAASLLAILAIVAFAHFLGFSRSAEPISEQEAADFLRFAAGGFEPKDVAVVQDGRGAIARDAEGQSAVLIAHGNRFVARRLQPDARVSLIAEELRITDAALGSRPVVLRFHNSVPPWVCALADAK